MEKCIEISRAVRSSVLESILDIFEPKKNSKRGIRIFEMAELRTLQSTESEEGRGRKKDLGPGIGHALSESERKEKET